VQTYLNKHNIACYSFDDTVILPSESINTQQGSYFKVFTPFKKAWYKQFLANKHRLLPVSKPQKPIPIPSSIVPTALKGFTSAIDPKIWPSGEKSALHKLEIFIKHHLFSYDKNRDFPASDGTSKLSPYLSTGMISPRLCFLKAFDTNQQELDTGNKGAVTWMIELIWRDFYKHLLIAVPKLSMHHAFKPETEKIKWLYDEKKLHAWRSGNTGIPIVDAAMRQLNTTGWMHNRLRMIVAMFFSKNLFFDWRLGEDYFIHHLIDGDLAANNGGWQWSASTGTDAAPYFRVFNPIRQSERFDPEGIFIRTYCPELRDFDNHAIHAPHERMPLLAKNTKYPEPIVNLDVSRKYAIAEFKKILSSIHEFSNITKNIIS
jgi:deoxyribodipyrimidine photo-lyase